MTLRSANAGSISSVAMDSRTSLTHVRSLGASPRTAVTDERRKFDTDTPGTSTGYCMARKTPARARSSTLCARTSTPSSVTVPSVIVYLGWPAMEYASVDLPEPFGPMIAWVSPRRIVRSTPRRISLPSAESVSTETWRLRISRVDTLVQSPQTAICDARRAPWPRAAGTAPWGACPTGPARCPDMRRAPCAMTPRRPQERRHHRSSRDRRAPARSPAAPGAHLW